MLGRLPTIYRWRTVALVVTVSVIAGGWLALSAPLAVLLPTGIAMGGLAGILVAYVAVHDSASAPRLVRVRHRR